MLEMHIGDWALLEGKQRVGAEKFGEKGRN